MKKQYLYILILASLFLASQSFAQGFIKDQKGCLHHLAAQNKSNSSITWTGNCFNGYADGLGISKLYLNNRFTMSYNGTKFNGEREYGSLSWVSGNTYRGPFLNGKAHGYGTHRWANGKIYNGNFTNGRQNPGVVNKTLPRQPRKTAQEDNERRKREQRRAILQREQDALDAKERKRVQAFKDKKEAQAAKDRKEAERARQAKINKNRRPNVTGRIFYAGKEPILRLKNNSDFRAACRVEYDYQAVLGDGRTSSGTDCKAGGSFSCGRNLYISGNNSRDFRINLGRAWTNNIVPGLHAIYSLNISHWEVDCKQNTK